MLLGKRVITPDNEQSFISCLYDDCSVDVDILADDAENAEDTTTINYDKGVITPCTDQTPQLNDITPYGQVLMLGILTDGILEVVLNTGYERVSTLWLSEKRLNTLPSAVIEYGHWTDPKDFTKWVDYHDLRFVDHEIIPKYLAREATPHEAHLRVEFPDKATTFWDCRVDGNGQIDYVKTDTGQKLTTLEELRALGATSVELQCNYSIEDFDRKAFCKEQPKG